MKHIGYDSTTGYLSADNAAGLKVKIKKNLTDIQENESVEDFTVRHGGISATAEYLASL